jgi:hypothetical protein
LSTTTWRLGMSATGPAWAERRKDTAWATASAEGGEGRPVERSSVDVPPSSRSCRSGPDSRPPRPIAAGLRSQGQRRVVGRHEHGLDRPEGKLVGQCLDFVLQGRHVGRHRPGVDRQVDRRIGKPVIGEVGRCADGQDDRRAGACRGRGAEGLVKQVELDMDRLPGNRSKIRIGPVGAVLRRARAQVEKAKRRRFSLSDRLKAGRLRAASGAALFGRYWNMHGIAVCRRGGRGRGRRRTL